MSSDLVMEEYHNSTLTFSRIPGFSCHPLPILVPANGGEFATICKILPIFLLTMTDQD
jgi:hypothetical protein